MAQKNMAHVNMAQDTRAAPLSCENPPGAPALDFSITHRLTVAAPQALSESEQEELDHYVMMYVASRWKRPMARIALCEFGFALKEGEAEALHRVVAAMALELYGRVTSELVRFEPAAPAPEAPKDAADAIGGLSGLREVIEDLGRTQKRDFRAMKSLAQRIDGVTTTAGALGERLDAMQIALREAEERQPAVEVARLNILSSRLAEAGKQIEAVVERLASQRAQGGAPAAGSEETAAQIAELGAAIGRLEHSIVGATEAEASAHRAAAERLDAAMRAVETRLEERIHQGFETMQARIMSEFARRAAEQGDALAALRAAVAGGAPAQSGEAREDAQAPVAAQAGLDADPVEALTRSISAMQGALAQESRKLSQLLDCPTADVDAGALADWRDMVQLASAEVDAGVDRLLNVATAIGGAETDAKALSSTGTGATQH